MLCLVLCFSAWPFYRLWYFKAMHTIQLLLKMPAFFLRQASVVMVTCYGAALIGIQQDSMSVSCTSIHSPIAPKPYALFVSYFSSAGVYFAIVYQNLQSTRLYYLQVGVLVYSLSTNNDVINCARLATFIFICPSQSLAHSTCLHTLFFMWFIVPICLAEINTLQCILNDCHTQLAIHYFYPRYIYIYKNISSQAVNKSPTCQTTN